MRHVAKVVFAVFLCTATSVQSTWAAPVKLAADTPIKLRLEKQLRSGREKRGEPVPFAVAEAIPAEDGTVLIPSGAKAGGEITRSRGRSGIGKSGRIAFEFEYVEAPDSTRVPIRAQRAVSAGSKQGAVIATAALLTPPTLFFKGKAVAGTAYRDASARSGHRYIYAVTCEEWSRLESDVTSPTLSVAIAADGRVWAGRAGEGIRGWDRAAPEPVERFTASPTAGELIRLAWKPSTSSDLRYYNVYASGAGAPVVRQKRLFVSPAHDQTAYVDWTAGRTSAVQCAITAMDSQGNESLPTRASVP